jgi:outer membrane protein assembly factor BamE (lipoprotein component of BamABCDE complex)
MVIALSALALTGCASNLGTQTVNDFSRFMQLEPGATDKAGVYALFGQPHLVHTIDESEESIWTYYSIRETMNATTYIPYLGLVTGGSDVDSTRADFFFDSAGVYLRSDREESSRYKNMWLGMGDAFTPSGQVRMVQEEMERLGLPFDERAARENAAAADQFAD